MGPSTQQLANDAAAYDPETDKWRRLADAPQPVAFGTATWTGDQLVLLVPGVPFTRQEAATLTYDPATDRWRRLVSPPEGYLSGGRWNGQHIVYWQSEEASDRDDWLLDPSTGAWTPIPADPFGSTFDRSYTWIGDRYLFTALLSSDLKDDVEGERHVYQVAEYSAPDGSSVGEGWRQLPDSSVGFWDPIWFWHDGSVVNPSQEAIAWSGEPRPNEPSPGGKYDPSTGQWTSIPQVAADASDLDAACQYQAVGSAGSWIIGDGPVLVSPLPADTHVAPACGDLAEPDVAVWTGEELLVWGGPSREHRTNLNAGFFWAPPAPR